MLLEELAEAIRDGDIAPTLQVLECDTGMVDSLVNILEARANVADDEESTFATIESVIVHGDLADISREGIVDHLPLAGRRQIYTRLKPWYLAGFVLILMCT